jgi:hypothetical protein
MLEKKPFYATFLKDDYLLKYNLLKKYYEKDNAWLIYSFWN